MQETVLQATKRTKFGKSFRRIAASQLPGVVYGKTMEPTPISVDEPAFNKALREAGSNKVIDLVIGEDSKNPTKVLIHDVQYHPLTNQPTHFDLYAVNLKEKLRADVPLHFVGRDDIELVRSGEATLATVYDTVLVEANPLDLPEHIEVDVSQLKEIGDHITAGDLNIGSKAEVVTDENEVLVKLDVIRETEEEELEPVEGEIGELGEEGGEAPPEGEEDGAAESEASAETSQENKG